MFRGFLMLALVASTAWATSANGTTTAVSAPNANSSSSSNAAAPALSTSRKKEKKLRLAGRQLQDEQRESLKQITMHSSKRTASIDQIR